MQRVRSIIVDLTHAPLWRALARGVLLAVILVLAAKLCAHWTYDFVHPYFRALQLAQVNEDLAGKVAAKRDEKKALEQKISWWNSPAGEEELAHSAGLVKKGEHTLVLTIATPKPSAAAATPAPAEHALGGIAHPKRLLAAGAVFVLAFIAGIALLLRRRRLLRANRPAGTLTPRSELQRRRHSPATPGV